MFSNGFDVVFITIEIDVVFITIEITARK